MSARRALSVLAAGALLLVACSGDGGTTKSTTTTQETEASTTACHGCPTYGETDTAITASPGDEFVIALESNPSTGYEWTATSTDTAVVEVVADEYVAPGTDRLGAPGTQRFLLEAVAPGSSAIQLRYARSFEPDDPDAREVTFTVTVA